MNHHPLYFLSDFHDDLKKNLTLIFCPSRDKKTNGKTFIFLSSLLYPFTVMFQSAILS